MEILFENRYFVTKDVFAEFLKGTVLKKTRVLSLVLMVMDFIIIYIVIKEKKSYGELIGFCLIFLLAVALYFLHIRIGKNMYNNTLEFHTGKLKESILRFGEEAIMLEEGKTFMEFEYSQIKKIYELKKLYVLMLGKQNGIVLRKDSFSVGTIYKFRDFIKEKCRSV